ncbi:MAG: HEPN domain-containing protein [Candidatus Freyarchaeota archaeon]|nr:HEPN domain-containing protein [Candidatus Jordarchaeia archaeon]MBS7268293.1 HEPN domain-containing protein [Candidatus Jordarchaeia archaeon]MBS7279221.1 HEPN domain-containing protein [Candidatus Jordarchaeia archaeon]
MPERSRDWERQADRDLNVAEEMLRAGFFEWSCFVAQQAAEKAVKAVLQKMNATAWGHSVHDFLKILAKKLLVGEEILDCAKTLDKYYIPTRYPNSFESGSPYEYFTRRDAENAIICCRRIIEFCKGILAGSG